jgi:hypothetical protein
MRDFSQEYELFSYLGDISPSFLVSFPMIPEEFSRIPFVYNTG